MASETRKSGIRDKIASKYLFARKCPMPKSNIEHKKNPNNLNCKMIFRLLSSEPGKAATLLVNTSGAPKLNRLATVRTML
jgi:hypothetical protein